MLCHMRVMLGYKIVCAVIFIPPLVFCIFAIPARTVFATLLMQESILLSDIAARLMRTEG